MKFVYYLIYKIFQFFVFLLFSLRISDGSEEAMFFVYAFIAIYYLISGILYFLLQFIIKNSSAILIADIMAFILFVIFVTDAVLADGMLLIMLVAIGIPYILIVLSKLARERL